MYAHAPGRIGGQKKRQLAGREDWLHAVTATEPNITLAELQKRLAGEGVAISSQAINATLRVAGLQPVSSRDSSQGTTYE